MKFSLTVAEDELKILNKLEEAMTASGLTSYPRRFINDEDGELEIIIYEKDTDTNENNRYFKKETLFGVKAFIELKNFLDIIAFISAEKLGIKEELGRITSSIL